MDWSNSYLYLTKGNPEGFLQQRLTRQAQRSINQNNNSWSYTDCRALLKLMCELTTQPINFRFYSNGGVSAIIANYRNPNTSPQLVISEHTKNITAAFDAIDSSAEMYGFTSDKTAALSLTAVRFDRFRVLQKDNTIIIFTNRKLSTSEFVNHMRKVIALFPRWFPVKENTTDIWMSLLEETPDNFYTYLAAYLNANYVQDVTQYIETFKNISQNNLEQSRQQFETQIHAHKNTIESAYKRITELWQSIYELQEKVAGINENNFIELGIELIKYIDKRPGIELDELTDDGALALNVTSELRFFDQEAAQKIIQRRESDIVKCLLTDVFVNNRYQIKFGTALILNLDYRHNEIIKTDRSVGIDPNTIWNPHLYYYDCWGSNRAEIQKAIGSQQLIAAIEQVHAATCSLNVLDGAVWNRFTNDLTNALINNSYNAALGTKDSKCLKDLQTGECITLAQYKSLNS